MKKSSAEQMRLVGTVVEAKRLSNLREEAIVKCPEAVNLRRRNHEDAFSGFERCASVAQCFERIVMSRDPLGHRFSDRA